MSKKMKFWIGVLIILGLGAYFSGDDSGPRTSNSTTGKTNKTVGKGKIKQEAYFKKNKTRIFVFSISENTPSSQVQMHARKQMNTSGKMTTCYYYKTGASIPRDGVTRAINVAEANKVMNRYRSGIEYAYVKYVNGSEDFTDCSTSPNHWQCSEN